MANRIDSQSYRIHAAPRRLRKFMPLGVLITLMGCAPANQVVSDMDNFFDAMGVPRFTTGSGTNNRPAYQPTATAYDPPYLLTGPGYAPAYPTYDAKSYQFAH